MVAIAAIVAALWAVWLLRDRPALVATTAVAAAAILGVALWRVHRSASSAALGTLSVDDQGQVLWQTQAALPRQWHRTERSVWLRLEVGDPRSAGSAGRAATIDLTIGIGDVPTTDWIALQRWLLWMERGIAH